MPLVQHIGILKFKPEVTTDKTQNLFNQLKELQLLIPGITYFSGGIYSSNEGLNQDFTHAFLMTFESVEARDNYLPHPEHERVKAEILPCINDLIVFDFEA